jgi:hypothetical protein
MTPDDEDDFALYDDGELSAEDIAGEECGRWRNGRLAPLGHCTKAGSEECDWECPYSRETDRS